VPSDDRSSPRLTAVLRRLGKRLVAGERSESGQAVVWATVLMPLFLSLVGLSVDSVLFFNARLDLQNAAAAAARAGATQIDERAYRESGGATVALDPARARRVAAEALADRGLAQSGTIDANTDRVAVRVSREVPTSFLRLIKIDTAQVAATAAAELRFGVERGNR